MSALERMKLCYNQLSDAFMDLPWDNNCDIETIIVTLSDLLSY